MLPLRYAPLQLEFTIVQNGNDPIVVPKVMKARHQRKMIGTVGISKQVIHQHSGKWEINSVIIVRKWCSWTTLLLRIL